MAKEGKIEERIRLNAPFIRAFDWLRTQRHLTQDEMAKQLESNGSLISMYRNGKKLAGEDIKGRLARAFGGRLYMPFLDGLSPYMLIENVPEEEIRQNINRDNPDFAQLLKDERTKSRIKEEKGTESIIDLYATLIKELEAMRSDLASDLRAVQELKYQLTQEREALHTITTQLQAVLHPSVKYDLTSAATPMAAEPEQTKN
jgi:transcriptional regulator with XRE-family HTH domain